MVSAHHGAHPPAGDVQSRGESYLVNSPSKPTKPVILKMCW